jgi:methylmalonyl-CoA/ethylmalonyl-CoA epimerase
MSSPTESSAMEFDHAGIATRDADATAQRFAALFDAPVAHEERFEGMSVVFLELDDGYFELLEPHEGGAIDSFLERNGPGIHHVALATDDIEAALRRVRQEGVRLVDERPRPGAWGHEVAFLHPESTGGVLVEFVAH